MASRRPHAPTIPSATNRAPGSIPGIFGAPLEHEQQPTGGVDQDALEVGGAGPGLDSYGPHPARDPDPLTPPGIADGLGATRPPGQGAIRGRRAWLAFTRTFPTRHGAVGRAGWGRRTRDEYGRTLLSCHPLDQTAVTASTLGPGPQQVVGDDRGAHMRHLADDGGDLVGRPVVEEALPGGPVPPAREENGALGVTVGNRVSHQLDGRSGQAPVGAFDHVERESREAQPAPVLL